MQYVVSLMVLLMIWQGNGALEYYRFRDGARSRRTCKPPIRKCMNSGQYVYKGYSPCQVLDGMLGSRLRDDVESLNWIEETRSQL